jgi:hypothetical protein
VYRLLLLLIVQLLLLWGMLRLKGLEEPDPPAAPADAADSPNRFVLDIMAPGVGIVVIERLLYCC